MTSALRPLGVGVGHPRPPRCSGPSVPWVSLPGPTGVPPMSRQDGMGSRSATMTGNNHQACADNFDLVLARVKLARRKPETGDDGQSFRQAIGGRCWQFWERGAREASHGATRGHLAWAVRGRRLSSRLGLVEARKDWLQGVGHRHLLKSMITDASEVDCTMVTRSRCPSLSRR